MQLFSQKLDCPLAYQKFGVINSESGLNLRKGPSLNSQKILSIPKGAEIQLCQRYTHPETIDGLEGSWFKSLYKDKVGYLFSAYIDILKCHKNGISLVVSNDGSVDNFPLIIRCENYLGVYESKSNSPNAYKKKFDVKKIDLIDTTFNYHKMYFGAPSNIDDKPLFYLSGINIRKDKVEGRLLNKRYFPFESENIWLIQSKDKPTVVYHVYAKGTGIENESSTAINKYSGIKDYQVWLRISDGIEFNTDLLLFKGDIGEWGGSYDGGAWIYWIGDLNEDNIPDIIYKTSKTYKGWRYKLLLSDPSEKEIKYKTISVGGGSPC